MNNALPIFISELEKFRRFLLKLLIPVAVAAALYVVWAKSPGHFVREIGGTRLTLAEYFQNHGRFPDTLAEVDRNLAGAEDEIAHEFKATHWYYRGGPERYTLSRRTFLKTSIKFAFDGARQERSGWFLEEENGLASRMPQFPFLDDERKLLKDSVPGY